MTLDSKLQEKNRSVKVIILLEEEEYDLSEEMKTILDERLAEDQATYLSANESLDSLRKKYGV